MIHALRRWRLRVALASCAPLRLTRRPAGRHHADSLAAANWYPRTPAPEPAQLELRKPRVIPDVKRERLASEWLSREYATLYQWVADMETAILQSDLRARYA